MEHDGTLKFPQYTDPEDPHGSKSTANNIRFDNARVHGAIVTAAPQEYAHVRNKLQFTGQTAFVIEDSPHLDDVQKRLYLRSTLLAPHYSIEMGTFSEPADANQMTELHGTIVAGLVDMRGNIRVKGTILSTFHPKSGDGPVIGETSPWFNMAIGYFDSDAGDMEASLPAQGRGMIQIRYDPSTALADGINGPIEVRPMHGTYFESGK